jgi:hypothetical protein
MANSEKYGGAGYSVSNIATASGHEEQGRTREIGLHEFGHSFGNLGDEYWTEGQDYTGDEPVVANLSTYYYDQMKNGQEKWYRWLDEPTDPPAQGPIHTYEGGGVYYATGIYRPTDWSKMRRLYDPFHQVNVEQLVLKIYEIVDPIDYATPEGTYALGTVFFVEPVQPATHSQDVQWYLNNDPIEGATGPEFDSSTLDLSTGQYYLKVEVVDNTPMVKDETARSNYMYWDRTWTLGEAGHWKFDEGSGDIAYDSIGDNDGRLGAQVGPDSRDPAWVDDPDRGWCLDFDVDSGEEDYVSLSAMNALADSDATISAWIKIRSGSGYHPIVSTYEYFDSSGDKYGYLLYVKNNLARFYLASGVPHYYVQRPAVWITEDVWYHIAGTYDGVYLKIYVNGERNIWWAPGLTGFYEEYDNTYIGYEDRFYGDDVLGSPDSAIYFDGLIDDVRIYDWAMGQAEIWEIMSAGTSEFSVKDNSRVRMAWFDNLGNLFLRGSLEQGYGSSPWREYNDGFKFQNSAGTTDLAIIDGTNGNMYIYDRHKNWRSPSGQDDKFIIEKSNGDAVSYIDESGNLYLSGELYENPQQ